ncbi:odorant receptor 13a-like [Phymastichus coffea]|uniref:odorant receptor 13a-like n=1 Tax=Phymastichus coffea TaxID=108790 RepID=UPI00273AD821|nr:odorant receptor 13a-like [Phymastichus coffea]
MECLPNIFYNIIMAIKFYNGVVNQHKIKLVLEKIKRDWNQLQNNEQIKIIRGFYDSGKVLIICYIGIVYFVLLSFMGTPLTPVILDLVKPLNESRPKSALYIVEFFVDQHKYYYSILFHGYVTSLFGILPLFANDIFLCNCVHHASGMLAILGYRVRSILKIKPIKENLDDQTYKQVIDCTLQHQSIIEFCDDVNKIYSTSFFFVLIVSVILMSITGFVTLIKLEDSFKDCYRFAVFTIAQIFHMFCYNFLGQKLLNESEIFFNNVCTSDWHLGSKKVKYIVKFMIMRSSKSNNLQTKLFSLTLENFTSVMKASMSYFTVFKSTR